MLRPLAKHFRGYYTFLLIACAMVIVHPNAYAFAKNQGKNEIIVEKGLSTKEYEAAVDKALKALATDPNDLDARRSLAKALYYLEKYDRALAEQKNVIDIASEPTASDFLLLGHISNELGDEERAIEAFNDAVRVCRATVELNPDNLDARRDLVHAYFQLNEFERALEEQKIVMERAPEPIEGDYHSLGAIYTNLGNDAQALAVFKQGADLFGTENLWFKVALTYAALDDHEGEVYAYQKVLELNPDDYWARRNLVDAYMNLCKLDLALEQQKIAIERAEEPEWGDYYDLWRIYEELGDTKNMLQTFRKAEQLFGPEKAWSIRAWGYMKAKDYERAADAARRMLEINPKSVDGRRALAYSYDSLEKYEQALEEYKALFEMTEEPTERDYRNLGVIYELLGDKENAVRTFQKSADVFGTETSWEFVAMARGETGDYNGAIEACHILLKKNPDSVMARRGLASAYTGLKDYERALEEQETALEMTTEPEEGDYWNLAIIYSRLKDYNAAVDAYRKTLELNPGNRDARLYLARNLSRIGEYEAAANELSKQYSTTRDRALFVFSLLKRLVLPLIILSLLLLLSRSSRLAPIFCESSQEEKGFRNSLLVMMVVFVLCLLSPSLVHNPFAPDYQTKVLISLYQYDSSAKGEMDRYVIAYLLAQILIPAYYMRKYNIPILPLFTVDWSLLKRMVKYLLAGLVLLVVLSILTYGILTLVFPSELKSSMQMSDRRDQALHAFSLFGKISVVLIFPFIEEFFFRGMVFSCLRKRFKTTWSIIFSALLFMASHYFRDGISLVSVFILGLVLAYLVHKTRSLWPPFIFHALMNSTNVFL